MRQHSGPRWFAALATFFVAVLCVPALALATNGGSVPTYKTLDELKGKRIAYVNGSVYNQNIANKIEGTKEQFYASLADCVTAVKAGKADAAVQLSYCLELVVNQQGDSVALLPEHVDDVDEAFFFPHGDPLVAEFDRIIDTFEADGTLDTLRKKWVSGDDADKTLPKQDWDAPNGTLKFATSGVLEPYSYVGNGGEALGYDVELALLIARELGYHLEVSTITMDAIFASVEAGKVDFGGTLTRTDERAQKVDFTKKVIPSYVAVLVAAESGAGDASSLEFSSFTELEGRKVGVINGSVMSQVVDSALSGSRDYKTFNTMGDMVAALKAEKIDAFVADEPIGALIVNKNEGVGIIPGTIIEDHYGMIFQKGSPLKAKFDSVLQRYRDDGTIKRLQEKWTGKDEATKTMPEQGWDAPNGTLTMTTSTIFEPLEYLRDNEIVGYEIELAMLICKELGYDLKIVNQDFSASLAGVQAGKYDFGCSAISITEERQREIDFSIPDYDASPVFVVRTKGGQESQTGFLEGLSVSFYRTFIEENRWQLIVSGLGVTVVISVASGVLGLLLGYLTVLARRKGAIWPTRLVNAYQALMGGVPLVVVLMVLFYVVFGSLDIPAALVAVVAFTLAFGSTAGSTMWTAVDSIDNIQEETGLALGYTRQQVFRKIIFPQARQQFVPQLAGQFVSLVKDTAIVGYIAVQDLTRASDLIRARTMDAFFPLISTAIIYFLICRLLAWVFGKVAAKLDVTKRPRKIEGVVEAKEVQS